MIALFVIKRALLMINIPVDQLSGEVLTGEAFWSKLNIKIIVSSALNTECMLRKFHGPIRAVGLQKILTLLLHGLHHICLGVLSHIL